MFEYRATVRSVHDGDSLRADVDLGFGIWTANQPLRLLGIDAPELGKPGGIEARNYLRGLLPVGTPVVIRTVKDEGDKYGRLLATVVADQPDGSVLLINQQLIAAGHARPYDGGPR